jgi:DNA-nicking Smr family endonuclease
VEKKYKQSQREASLKIFAKLNNDQDNVLDLHGLYFEEAIAILNDKLPAIRARLKVGNHSPKHHIIKVVCGAGYHSQGGIGILKYKVPETLRAQGWEIYCLECVGAVFVHITI